MQVMMIRIHLPFPVTAVSLRLLRTATNLVIPDGPAYYDVFVHSRSNNQITQVSVSSSGEQGNQISGNPSISHDGHYVAFSSAATSLVSNDFNNRTDIFLHDRLTGQTELVSVSSAGEQANNHCHSPSISADGRYVAFLSLAANLVLNDTNSAYIDDVFFHDRGTKTTTLVSVSSSGEQANGSSSQFKVSANGRFIAFRSSAGNLVSNDTNGYDDIFVYDRDNQTTERVSVSSSEEQATSISYDPSISADGRYIAFVSLATNLVAEDTNGDSDVFVRDRHLGTIQRVSISSRGEEADDGSGGASISADGHYVVFESNASNLVGNDTNGVADIFVQSRLGSVQGTYRVNVNERGTQAEWHCRQPAISADGHYVVFSSASTNLVRNDDSGLDVNNVFLSMPLSLPVFHISSVFQILLD